MTSEVVRYVKSRTPAPTYRQLRAYFRRQGRELLLVEIDNAEIEVCRQMGIAYFEEDGKLYAIATVERF